MRDVSSVLQVQPVLVTSDIIPGILKGAQAYFKTEKAKFVLEASAKMIHDMLYYLSKFHIINECFIMLYNILITS